MIDKALLGNKTLWDFGYNEKKLAILRFLYYSNNYAPFNAFTCSQIHSEVKSHDNQQQSKTHIALERLVRWGAVRVIRVSLIPNNPVYQITKTGRDKYKELRDRTEMRLTTGVNVSLWLKDNPPSNLISLHQYVKKKVHVGSNASTWRLPDDERLALYLPVRREYFEEKPYQLLDYYRCGGDISPYQDLIDRHGIGDRVEPDNMVEPMVARHQIAQDGV